MMLRHAWPFFFGLEMWLIHSDPFSFSFLFFFPASYRKKTTSTDQRPCPCPLPPRRYSWTLPSLRRGTAVSLCVRAKSAVWFLSWDCIELNWIEWSRVGCKRRPPEGGGRIGKDGKTYLPNCLLLYADSLAVQGLMMVSDGET